jgi:hypothetical protein
VTVHTIFLTTDNARERMATAWRVACEILQFGKPVRVQIDEKQPTRSLEQNARLWALLSDVARQVQWPVDGRLQYLSPEEWKYVFSASLRKGQRVAQGIEGGFVMLGCRTSRMTVGEMVDLQTLIEAFGVEHGVRWGDERKAA